MRHPLILSMEIDLLRAREREIEAKNAAEAAMRHWAYCCEKVGYYEGALHSLRKQFGEIPSNP